MTFLRIYELNAREGAEAQMLAALRDLGAAVKVFSGCEGVELAQDTDNEARFTFIERWTDSDAWEASKPGPAKELFKALMAAAAGPPEARSAVLR